MASDLLRINGMAERVAVVGAGIAGLGTAMALARAGREVTVIERDPPAPANVETAFDTWERKGVTQLRHSHVFLGKLVGLIRERHPRLHQMLQAAGAREFDFEAALPPALRARYTREEGDRELAFLFSRRTTLEHVMRAYVQSLPGVTFVTDATVRALVLDRGGGTPKVTGVVIERGDAPAETFAADVVVDASGRNTILVDWLRDHGIAIDEEKSPAGILYFTRHYRLRPGQDEPPRDLIPGAGDLGYIKYGVFPADNRHFSITICVPEIESRLRVAAVDPLVFDRICRQIPGASRWIEPARAEPVTKVFGMGNLHNVWRHFVKDGAPAVLNYFAVGDSALRTNPLYGRGCSSAVIQAHLLADVLNAETDPATRALAFDMRTRESLRSFWDVIAKQDLGAIRRAKNEQTPGYKPRFKARLIKSFTEDAVGPASRGDLAVHRALMRGFHMFNAPTAWLRRPLVVLRVLITWATPKRFKRALYPPKLGPERKEMLAQLGLEPA
jgi:2-polyprenyl-6-methoxyphenol hydroxylase-like FAD-dependent oxidoreductase